MFRTRAKGCLIGLVILAGMLGVLVGIGLISGALDQYGPFTAAERAAPSRELHGSAPWAVQRALGFEIPEPVGLPYDGSDARSGELGRAVGQPAYTAAWRWATPTDDRQIFVIAMAQPGITDEELAVVFDALAGGAERTLGARGYTITSTERRGPLELVLRGRVTGEGSPMFGRVLGYRHGPRGLMLMILAIARHDLGTLERVVEGARAIEGEPVSEPAQGAPVASGDVGALPREGEPVAGPFALAAGGAFDLITDGRATLLVWADPAESGGAIRSIELGSQGQAIGTPRVLVAGSGAHIRDVAAARVDDRIALAWITQDARSARALAGISEPGSLASPVQLGEAPLTGSTRGRVAIAPLPEGTFVAAARLVGARATVALVELGGDGRRIPVLALEAPCEEALVGAVGTEHGAVLALCDGAPGSESLVRIELDGHGVPSGLPETRALGCAAMRMVDAGHVVDRCGGATRVTGPGGPRELAESATVACEVEHPMIGLPLDHPLGNLAAVLPPSVAPVGARAIWSGDAVLVGVRLGPELVVQRRQCRAGALLRTDLL